MPKKRKVVNQMSAEQLVGALQKLAVSAPASKPKKKRKRKAKKNINRLEEGAVTVSRHELLGDISMGVNKSSAVGHFDLIPDSFGFLKNLMKSFERIRWKKIHVYYKPAVGSTYGGLVTVGMDWDWASEDVSRAKLAGMTPSFTCAAWNDTESRPMIIPPARIQARAWYSPNLSSADYIDKGPGKLHWACNGDSSTSTKILGELWIAYTVDLLGTNIS